ncbi:MAG: YkvA family protein [Anaerolineae bacterium]
MSSWRARLHARALAIERETYALYLAFRHPRTPWYARAWAVVVIAYAASPIDLIPDVIPFLGYLDDLLLIPLGIWLAVRLVPEDVMADCRARAGEVRMGEGRLRWLGLAITALLWVLALSLAAVLALRYLA